MEGFFFWLLIALGPSIAAVAWFVWYSEAFESAGRDKHEPWIGS
jgi:hypothetical protein